VLVAVFHFVWPTALENGDEAVGFDDHDNAHFGIYNCILCRRNVRTSCQL